MRNQLLTTTTLTTVLLANITLLNSTYNVSSQELPIPGPVIDLYLENSASRVFQSDITYSGYGGIRIFNSNGNFTGTFNGSVTQEANSQSGFDTPAINVGGGDNIAVTLNGDVSTVMDRSQGVVIISDSDSVPGTINVSSSGSIVTSGDEANAVALVSGSPFLNVVHPNFPRFSAAGAPILYQNSGLITTNGIDSKGISIQSHGSTSTLINSGAITTNGLDSRGIQVESGTTGHDNIFVEIYEDGEVVDSFTKSLSEANTTEVDGEVETYITRVSRKGGKVDITNSGSITTVGKGVYAKSNGGDAVIKNTGVIKTSGDEARGIDARTGNTDLSDTRVFMSGGIVTIENEASVETAGDDSNAINGWSNGGNVTLINSGLLKTEGDNSSGLRGSSGENRGAGNNTQASLGGTVTINNMGNVTTSMGSSTGVEAFSNGGDISVTNSGAVTTTGDDSRGVGASSGTNRTADNRVVQAGGDISLDNSGTVETSGNNSSHALEAYSYGGNVTLTNTGELTTNGNNSFGIGAFSGTDNTEGDRVPRVGGTVNVTNDGIITTNGNDARGIGVFSNGGDVSVTNSGVLTTSGNNSRGLQASSGSSNTDSNNTIQAGGNIVVANNAGGNISTSGDDSTGLDAWSNGGAVSVINAANISASGRNSDGVRAGSGEENYDNDPNRTASNGGDVSLSNSGTIEVTGDDSNGLSAQSVGGQVTVSNSGNVTIAADDFRSAIRASSVEEATNSSGALTSSASVTNSGMLTTGASATDSRGIEARSQTVTVVNNTGDMDINGRSAIEAKGNTSASIVNEGNLLVTRNVSDANDTTRAVEARSAGTSFVDNKGTVTVTGDSSRGLSAGGLFNNEGGNDDGRSDIAIVSNSGTVTTSGADNSHAVDLRSQSEGTINNTGTISASGDSSRAIQIFSAGTVILNNSGTISNTATNRSAIGSTGEFSNLVQEGSVDLINNSGTISGGIFLGEKDDIVNNTGTLAGDVLLGADNDTLNLDAGGDISGANFFGDSNGFDARVGVDTVNFDGSFTIDGSQFSEFENAVLLSGTSSGTGLNTFTQLFTVGANATFNAGGSTVSNLTSNGKTMVGSAGVLNVTGDLNVGGTGTLDIGVASATNFGNTIVGGNATFDSAGNLMISVDETNTLALTDTFTPLSANSITVGGVTPGDSFAIEDNFLAFNFNGLVEAGPSSGEVLTISLEEGFGQLVEQVSSESTSEITEVVEFLETTPTTTEQQAVSDAIKTVLVTFDDTQTDELETFIEEISTAPAAASPSTNAGTSTVQSAGSLIQARVEQRVAAAPTATAPQSTTNDVVNNYAPVEEPRENVFTQILITESGYGYETSIANNNFGGEWWLQGFGGVQRTKDGNTNVRGTNGGISVGYDSFLDSGALIGVGGVYTLASTKTTVAGGSTTTADSDTVGALGYFGNTFDNGFGISTSLGYFASKTDQTRVDSLNDTYNAVQRSYTTYGSASISYAIDTMDFVFTPSAGLTYTHVNQGGYTETSSTGGALSQTVSSSTLNSLIGSFGGSLSKTERVNGMNMSAEIHAAALYEFNDTLGSYSLSLGSGAVNFSAQNIASLDRLRGNIGGSLRFEHSNSLSTQIGYDAVFGSKTQEHNVRFRVGKKF